MKCAYPTQKHRLAALFLCLLPLLQIQAQDSTDDLPNFHKVNDRLYRGAQPRKDGMRKLAAIGVKTVISLREDNQKAREEAHEVEAAGMRYYNIPFKRMGRPTDSQVEQVLSLINAPENGVVFVHCQEGVDRTGTVMAVYRMVHDHWTPEEAIKEAVHNGMHFWQHGMKDYISDYYRDRVRVASPASKPTK